MSEKLYNVEFLGTVITGWDIDEVKSNLAKLMKANKSKAKAKKAAAKAVKTVPKKAAAKKASKKASAPKGVRPKTSFRAAKKGFKPGKKAPQATPEVVEKKLPKLETTNNENSVRKTEVSRLKQPLSSSIS